MYTLKKLPLIVGSLLVLLVMSGILGFWALSFVGQRLIESQPTPARPIAQAIQTVTPTPLNLTATPAAYPLPGQLPSPLPTRTPPIYPTIGPKGTPPPKPTVPPTDTPTTTPIPTALPLPSSNFNALWVEGLPNSSQPMELGSALWLSDPRDIGSRKLVVRFDNQVMQEVKIAPNGRQLAFTVAPYRGIPRSLWLVNLDGSGLKQLALDASQIMWKPDGHSLIYSASKKVEGADGTAMDVVDIATGTRARLQTFEPELTWHIVGWAANQREIYYARAKAADLKPRELWATDPNSKAIRKVFEWSDDNDITNLSPDGSKYLVGTPQGLAWRSIENQKQSPIILQPWGREMCGLTWSPDPNEVVLCQIDGQQPIEHIKLLNVYDGTTRILASFNVSATGSPFAPLSLSPDMQWLVSEAYQMGTYWFHLPTKAIVTVHTSKNPDPRFVRFVGWINKTTTQ